MIAAARDAQVNSDRSLQATCELDESRHSPTDRRNPAGHSCAERGAP